MTPLSGLQGMYQTYGLSGPADDVPHGSTGRDPSNWGGPVDPRHAEPGAHDNERVYGGTAYPAAPGLPGAAPPVGGPGGAVADRTPSAHSAPYPRHPQGEQLGDLEAAEQMRELHGVDLGAPAAAVGDVGTPYPVVLQSGRYDSPEVSALERGVPAQLRGGPAGTDVDQGDGAPAGYGFNLGRQFRRWFQDAIPRNWSTINGGERPFYGRHPVWQARFDGDGSPYAWAGNTSVDMALAPTPVSVPSPYEQPPNPTVAPVATPPGEAAVIDYGWVAG